MLYWADTQFGDLPNASEVGEMRETSYASQIQVIDSSLHQLVEQLKKRRLWNSTTVIVVGLNGHESPVHADELLPMNLYSESTHVALLIKPARAKREGSFQWKIDQNVSLVDIGRTLTEMMGGTVAEESSAATVSLIPTLTNPGATWDQNRPIVSESAWTSWRGLGAIRSSLRRGPYFMIFDEKTKFFNTLTDGLEMSPLAERDDADVQNSMVNELRQMGYTSFRNFNRVFLTRASFGKDLWRSTDLDRETTTRLRDIAEHNLHDGVLQSWRALAAAHAADWKVLRAASDQMKDGSFFRYIAERQLSNDAHDGRHSRATLPDGDPCLHLLFSPIKTMKNTATERLGRCDDTLLRALAIWHDDSAAEPERSRASEEFMQAIAMSLLEVRIARQNYATGLKWDTAFEVLDSPIRAELILSLPEFKKIRTVVKQRFAELRP
jgi:hypothetical protein